MQIHPVGPPTRVLARTNVTIGAASPQGVTSKAATGPVSPRKKVGHRSLVHEARSGRGPTHARTTIRAGGRPSRITAARNFANILAIVRAEHGDFDLVDTATACSRLAKVQRDSADGTGIDDRRVQTLSTTATRVSSSMKPREVASTL